MSTTLFRLETALGEVPPAARELAVSLDPKKAARFVADKAMELAFPERLDDELFRDVIYRSSLDNIDTMWRIIAGREPFGVQTPLGALAFAEMAAEVAVPLSQFERVYRVGIGLVWLCWYQEAIACAERTGEPLTELLSAPSMIIHAYIDALLQPMLARYDATRAETRRTREHLRRSILRQALEGTPVLEDAEAEQALGVTSAGEHLALAARGERLDPVDVAEHARKVSGAAVALTYRHAVDTWLIWLWRPSAFAGGDLDALRAALRRAPGAVALGDIGTGADGLGLAGRSALETSRLQALLGEQDGLMSHAEVRLEALLLGDPERARQFVRVELGPLDEDDARSARLRETATTWLASGSNVGTAARLGLHEHTVRNHIAQAEELLGFALASRRTELLVALRLRRMLDS
ncbi:MAG TPA: helix-turn-helix domain-containing protein [Solirubrobacteraceae bacterium]|jgi:DNA-binding CsgD family transcriptional regulator|nr:helix-turn-helix domain-containing protein [Solirubrobacteraceae bacterium]